MRCRPALNPSRASLRARTGIRASALEQAFLLEQSLERYEPALVVATARMLRIVALGFAHGRDELALELAPLEQSLLRQAHSERKRAPLPVVMEHELAALTRQSG